MVEGADCGIVENSLERRPGAGEISDAWYKGLMMRVLHTSDWHLGVMMKRRRCQKEQSAFLDWLLATMEEKSVEVIVVAGDVFHRANPPNAAQEQYYRFLAQCSTLPSLKKVVVAAGNHDSPTGIAAPSELLKHLDIEVVGGVETGDEARQQWLCPVEGEDGEVEAVVCAVPYLSEARMGIGHQLEESEQELQKRFSQAFGELYEDMARRVRQKWPEAALVATGHLTCMGEDGELQEGDYHSSLHRSGPAGKQDQKLVGTIGAFSPDIFGDDYDYVALGHIHRCYPVDRQQWGGTEVWYSGTPVPTTRDELSRRDVLIVDVGSQESTSVERVEVPRWRQIHVLSGSTEEVLESLREVEGDDEFPPYLYVDVELAEGEESEQPRRRIEEKIAELFDDDQAPQVVDYREQRERSVEFDDGGGELPPLEKMSEEEVFANLYERIHEGEGPPQDVMSCFHQVLDEYRDQD